MTRDEQAERVIEAAIPQLRDALKGLLVCGDTLHIFVLDLATGRGQGEAKIVCFIADECTALVLEGAARGIDAANKRYAELIEAKRKTA